MYKNKIQNNYRVDAEDAALGLDIWQGEFYFAVDSTGANKSRIQRLYLVRSHDDLRRGKTGEPCQV